jgi:glycerol-3-phosphate dehydrogenase (NAD+)
MTKFRLGFPFATFTLLFLCLSEGCVAFSFPSSDRTRAVAPMKFMGDVRRLSQQKRERKNPYLYMKATSSTPPPYPVRIAVLGGGNFGIALAAVSARNGIPTTLLVRTEEVANEINMNHRHPRYMSDLVLPSNVRATTNPASALSDATYIIHAVPCQYSREFLEDIKAFIPYGTPILSASKGIETSSLGFMNDIFRETLGDDRPYAFLSGPSFAREIVQGVATAVVIASEDLMLASDLAMLLSDDSFRVFTTKDVIGVEVGGAVKNVIALAAGMCEGLGLGTNAMSGLVTRGCGEMRRLGLTFGAMPSTLAGLSGRWMLFSF